MDNNALLTAIGMMVDAKLAAMEDRIVSKTQNVIFGMEEHLTFRMQGLEREMSLLNEVLAPFVKWSHSVEGEVRRIGSELAEVKQRLAKLENLNAA